MVTIVKGLLESVTDRWEVKDTEMNQRMDTLIQLQRDRLEMDKLQLEFQCELAGMNKKKKGLYYGCPAIN